MITSFITPDSPLPAALLCRFSPLLWPLCQLVAHGAWLPPQRLAAGRWARHHRTTLVSAGLLLWAINYAVYWAGLMECAPVIAAFLLNPVGTVVMMGVITPVTLQLPLRHFAGPFCFVLVSLVGLQVHRLGVALARAVGCAAVVAAVALGVAGGMDVHARGRFLRRHGTLHAAPGLSTSQRGQQAGALAGSGASAATASGGMAVAGGDGCAGLKDKQE